MYVKPADSARKEEPFGGTDCDGPPTDWSADSRFILRACQRGSHQDIWAFEMESDRPSAHSGRSEPDRRKAFPVVDTMFDESNGQFSPNGQWIAYQSNEPGQLEIYVQPFQGPGPKTRVSSGGGSQVRWRHDGRELFYLAPDRRLMAVPIRIDSKGVEVGTPVPLFATRLMFPTSGRNARQYMVSRDGQRFLVITPKEVTLPVTVILNWKPKP